MEVPVRKLTKAQLVWLGENKCRHSHTYLSHYMCFLAEKPDTSPLVEKNKVFFHKGCKLVIDLGIKEFSLHRLETTIIEGHDISQNWAERIGFEQECLMRKFDADGNNYYLYARII